MTRSSWWPARMNWQRRLRLGLAVFALVFGAVVFFAIRSREEPKAAERIARADPTAVIESTGAIVTQARGARQDFRVEAERQLTYAGGATRLETVRITVAERAGRSFEVTGREAEVGDNQARISVTGDVRMAVSDGLTARTERATYDDGAGLLEAPGRVEFARARMTGSGLGATYDRAQDRLTLLDQASIAVAPDASGGGSLTIASGSALLARREGYARFEQGARITRGGQIIEADTAMAHFAGGQMERVELLELRGNARISGSPEGGAGSLKSMAASDMNLHYGPADAVLSQALLSGNASVEVAGPEGTGGRRIAAQSLDLRFAPDGHTVVALVARDEVDLVLAAGPGAPGRRVQGPVLEGRGDNANGLTGLRLTDGVEYRERPAGSGGDERVARARTLDLALQPGMGDLQEARFAGQVVFTDRHLRAEAPLARYDARRGTLGLSGATADARRPTVTDEGIVVEADRVDLTLAGRRLTADGDVRTVLQPISRRAAPSDRAVGLTRPRLLKDDAPVYLTGGQLVYDGDRGHAVYTGGARLWQGPTAIQGDSIELDEEKGNLAAQGSVRTSLALADEGAEPGGTKTVASVASAAALRYEDRERRTTYTGTSPRAHVTGPQGDLTAETVEMYLDAAAAGLERVEAYGSVLLRSQPRSATAGPKARLATGDRLTYLSADGRYLMSGAPVTITEECRETLGKSLTFYRSADTISVHGNEEIRTQTKTGGACSESQVR